jgi:hypothetical protein
MGKLPSSSQADLELVTSLLRWADDVSIALAVILAIVLLAAWWL